jgi:hypothetical protein
MVRMTAFQTSAVDVGLARGTRGHGSFEIVDEFQFCGREAGPVNTEQGGKMARVRA